MTIESQKSNVRGTETIATKLGQMQPGATLAPRASEGRRPQPVADAQPVPSLARRVGMGTAVGERITFLTLHNECEDRPFPVFARRPITQARHEWVPIVGRGQSKRHCVETNAVEGRTGLLNKRTQGVSTAAEIR
jgi:hypothetical protein